MWFNGLLDLSVMQLILVTLGMTHVTIVSVTLYLHRHSAHNSLDLHPVLKHFFRFWLWLTTAQNTKEWTAIHRKHHAKCETEEDPHSPVVLGIRKVLFQGAELYAESATPETLERYGQRFSCARTARTSRPAFPTAPAQLRGRPRSSAR